jgi:hypothetical protein
MASYRPRSPARKRPTLVVDPGMPRLVQAHPGPPQGRREDLGTYVEPDEGQPRLQGEGRHLVAGSRSRLHEERARRQIVGHRLLGHRNGVSRGQEPVDGPERRVGRGRQGVPGAPRPRHRACLDGGQVDDLLGGHAERSVHALDVDAHLQRQSPAGQVVRGLRRAAGVPLSLRVVPSLHQVHHVGAEGLCGVDDERAAGERPAVHGEIIQGAVDLDPRMPEDVHQVHRLPGVPLVRGHDVRKGCPCFPGLDGVPPHAPLVEQEPLTVARREVEGGDGGLVHVVEGVADVGFGAEPGIGVGDAGAVGAGGQATAHGEGQREVVGIVDARRRRPVGGFG